MNRYDVAILGSGIGGTILACILAKHGLRVLVIEETTHPRFAIGESLIPETGVRLRILAEKHGVPEIGWLGSFHLLRDKVSAACGVKRNFSFMYHREGERHRPEETNQLPTLTPPFGPDSHLFRQDTDAFMAAAAVKYGAELRQQVKVSHIALLPDEVQIHLAGGGEGVRARFLIDAGGMRSLVSTQLGMRDPTPRFRTDTRALYNHFVGLDAADTLFDAAPPVPSALGQGTMHHVFDGGWMWIIPFHNHRQATNPLASVGMMLDRRKHPTPTGPTGDEFRSIIQRYPTIARHFANATAVRPWVGSGRLQYSQQRLLVGPVGQTRVLQLPHAASFVDPLYSSGMSVLTVAIDLIAEALLPALGDDRFDTDRFRRIEDVVNAGFDHYDHIVSRSFDAFRSYDLWNAWNRNWMMGNFLGTFGPLASLVRFLSTGDRAHLDATTAPGRVGVLGSHLPEVLATMLASSEDVGGAVSGALTDEAAAERIFARLGALPFLPPYMGFGRADQRSPGTFTLQAGARHVLWYRYFADPTWRDYATFPLLRYAWEAAGFSLGQIGDGAGRAVAAFRDVVSAGNGEVTRARG